MSSQPVTADNSEDELDLGASDEVAISILTSGKPIRSLVRLPTALVDEAKVRFDADGIHMTAVDPANVGMVDITAHADGFEAYRMHDEDADLTVGMNLKRLKSALSWARMRGDGDPVTLDILTDPTRVRVAVTRPDQGVKRSSKWFGIDPDSIRQEPEVPNLDLPCYATPDIKGFYDAVKAFGPDHAAVSYEKDTLVLSADDGDDATETVHFPNCAWKDDVGGDADGSEPSAIFSLDYLKDMAQAVKRSKADKLTLNWGVEFPTNLHFEHEEWGYEGQFMLAPRIQSDD